mmetsp:Transcript_965/g.966  ORF Transcript_965/g.966 Transcript_965/m.966 type:complete len:128 (-) Transcript_965:1744-2127(-)
MSEPIPPTPPDIDGYLSKLKHKQSIFGSWNKRYFVVNPETCKLEYYTTKPSKINEEPSGVIDLTLIQSIRSFDDNAFQIDAGSIVYLLRADSAAEQACWINEFERYIQERLDYEQRLVAYNVAQQEK